LTGTFYNEIGLNANFNMKRESIGEGESSLNEDSLLPLADEMLRCRKEDMDKINKMFNTNITVEFDSAWLNNRKEIELSLKQLEVEASQLAEGNDDNGQSEVGPGTAVDPVDGAVAESDSGVEHSTDENNVSSADENSGRRDEASEDAGYERTDDDAGDDSEGSGENDELIVDEHKKKEDEDNESV
jgi:hypothetical protein